MDDRSTLNDAKKTLDYSDAVARILLQDTFRMRCLEALAELALPQGFIGAGFLRNAIWDAQHNKALPTPLNDIDVVYFCAQSPRQRDDELERCLSALVPEANWQVKNQARMHKQHNHAPYDSCEQALSYWIEQETCVAVSLSQSGAFNLLAPYGLEANFAQTITINPRFPRPDVFKDRVAKKGWLKQWPHLRIQPYSL
jgi:hypothetical protein